MSHSRDSGQVEPLAALAAVVAVCLGLSLYVVVLDASLPGSPDRSVAATGIDRIERAVAPDGIASPARIDDGRDASPSGYHANVSLSTERRRWTAGSVPSPRADTAQRRLAVRVEPAEVRSGTLRVATWR